jgi:hypothetical protein
MKLFVDEEIMNEISLLMEKVVLYILNNKWSTTKQGEYFVFRWCGT